MQSCLPALRRSPHSQYRGFQIYRLRFPLPLHVHHHGSCSVPLHDGVLHDDVRHEDVLRGDVNDLSQSEPHPALPLRSAHALLPPSLFLWSDHSHRPASSSESSAIHWRSLQAVRSCLPALRRSPHSQCHGFQIYRLRFHSYLSPFHMNNCSYVPKT